MESEGEQSDFRSWAEIDREALRHNTQACRDATGGHCEIMAVVKADAYGHGAAEVARTIENEVDWFGVANTHEAIELLPVLQPEMAARILMLGPALAAERKLLIGNNFAASVSTVGEAEAFDRDAGQMEKIARVHVVADTGMGRMGAGEGEVAELIESVRELPNLQLEGVASHLPSADEDPEFTRQQIGRFRTMIDGLSLVESICIHLGNSAGLLGFAGELDFTSLVRPGLAIYGVSPLPEFQEKLKPALTLKTRITLVRELPAGTPVSYGRTFTAARTTLAATLGIGYGDGYPRSLSGNGAEVLIAGSRCPILGRVTMDQIVVDLTDLERPVHPGDEVVLIGRQGESEITASEIAEKAGTIPWEIFTGITGRVKRVFR